MEDVTALMNKYRECVRHLWNTQFWQPASQDQDWDERDAFEDIATALFREMVLARLGRDDVEVKPEYWSPQEPLPFLHVVTDPESEILVNRGKSGPYWDAPLRHVVKGELELRFIHYFDWGVLEFRDYAFYLTRIVGSEEHPEVVGRDALVPVVSAVKVYHAT